MAFCCGLLFFLVSECATFQKHHNEVSDRNWYVIEFHNRVAVTLLLKIYQIVEFVL